jgi:hypothetical protein
VTLRAFRVDRDVEEITIGTGQPTRVRRICGGGSRTSWNGSKGILCQGRGSAANSTVCYVLGVTTVDPSKHDLPFERFVSASRNEPPDIAVLPAAASALGCIYSE